MVSYSSEERLFSKGQTMSQAQYLNGYDDGYADAVKKIKASAGQGGGSGSGSGGVKVFFVGDDVMMPTELRGVAAQIDPSEDHDFKDDLPALVYVGTTFFMPVVAGDPGSSFSNGDVVLIYGKEGTTPLAYTYRGVNITY